MRRGLTVVTSRLLHRICAEDQRISRPLRRGSGETHEHGPRTRVVTRVGALVLAVALGPTAAVADQWVTINSDVKVAVLQIDIESIQKRDGYLSAWMRASYPAKRPDGKGSMYRSTLNLEIYDCESGRSALLELMEYDGTYATGKVVRLEHHSPQQAEWSYAPPGTAAVGALKIVCQHRPAH